MSIQFAALDTPCMMLTDVVAVVGDQIQVLVIVHTKKKLTDCVAVQYK